ncbi:MAG: hypothetical protein NTV51_25205 [Verrucomicrobia bacterium]|nr:hypothetical protein [Verrucomicrobiota bacterium]
MLHVLVDGAHAGAEDRGGVGVALALGDPIQDLGLARGEAELHQRGGARRGAGLLQHEELEIVAALLGETPGDEGAAGLEAGRKGAGRTAGKMLVQQVLGEAGAEDDAAAGVGEHDGAVERLAELELRLDAEGEFVGEGFLQEADLQVGGDAGEDLGRVDGLGDVVERTGLEGAELLLGFVDRRHEEHGHVLALGPGLEVPAGRDAVQARHDEVEQDEVGRGVLQQRERAAATLGDEDLVAGLGERIEQEREVGRGVVDDEDATGGGAAHGGGRAPGWARSRSSRMRSMR